MKIRIFPAASVAVALGFSAFGASAKDYIAAAVHPDKVVIVDAEAMKVAKVVTIADASPTPIVPVISPDAKYMYVLVKGSQSIVKIDLDSGATIGRIDMTIGEERVRALWAFALSPDGKTLAVFQNPTKVLASEFQVQPTRIAYYDAATLELKFTTPAPRQIVTLAYSTDGSKLYAMGRAIYEMDATTGHQIKSLTIQDFAPQTHLPADILNVWSQYETSDMVVTPYYTALKDKESSDPERFQTGLLTFDLRTGVLTMKDIEPTTTLYFSTTASPDRRRAYGVYNVLQSFDLENGGKPMKQVPLPQTFYSAIVSNDGKTLWIGGALGKLIAFDTETLEPKGEVEVPGGANMSNNSVRLFSKPNR